jgi:hypothetical protein
LSPPEAIAQNKKPGLSKKPGLIICVNPR